MDQRLRPAPAAPSTGAPIQVPAAPAPAASQPGAEAVRFTLSAVAFDGATALPPEALQRVAAPYVGRPVGLAELDELAARVTAAYRAAGYILVRAVVPPQSFADGRLTVRVVEGYIDNVQILGDPGGAARLLEAYGRKIKAARPLTRAVLERELLLASDITGLSVRSVLTPSASAPGAADLSLVVSRKRIDGYLGADNRGSRYLGPAQVMGGVFWNDAFGLAGRIGLSGVVTPGRGPDLGYGALSVDQPLGTDGLRLFGTASYTRTRPGRELRALDTEGEALNAQVSLSYPLIRSRDLNVLARGGFTYRDVRSSNAAVSPLFDDHVRALDLGVYANALDRWGGYSTLSVAVTQGLQALGASRPDSADTSRQGAGGAFTRLNFEATRSQVLAGPVSLLLGVSGQTAFNGRLLASEQYALGGYGYDRAFDPAEATGDSAVAGRVEAQWRALRRPFGPLTGMQPYGFFEGGKVWQTAALAGTPPDQTLESAGVGVRLSIANRISADLQWAAPLGPDVGLTRSRNPRVFVSLTAIF